MPPTRFPAPTPSPEVMGSLTGITEDTGLTAEANSAPGHDWGTDRPDRGAALPRPAAPWLPAPAGACPSPEIALGAAAGAGAAPPSQPADFAIWVPKLPIPTLKY